MFIAVPFFGGPALAQEQVEEWLGSAEVPVYEDNLDAARGRAVRGAQVKALRRAVDKRIATVWVHLFDAELNKSVFSRPERYVASYRARSLAASLDRTKYVARLTAQVNMSQLLLDLRGLGLPVLGDPQRPLRVLYAGADPVMSKSRARKDVLDKLGERLALLNFSVAGSRAIKESQAEILASPYGEPASRRAILRGQKSPAVLFLAFQTPPAETGRTPTLTAHFYQTNNGAVLGSFQVQSRRPFSKSQSRGPAFRDVVLFRLVQPMVVRLQPGGIKPLGAISGRAEPLQIKVLGYRSLDEEERFEQAFFRRDSPFKNFVLHRLTAQSVTYQGTYAGDRNRLENSLLGKNFQGFRIANVYWFNDVLELVVEPIAEPVFAEMKLFPAELRPPQAMQAFAFFQQEFPKLATQEPAYTEVEDNGWLNRANALPMGQMTHGLIDSRSDTDFFVAEALKSKEVVEISWYRLGRTNLIPLVRIFDAEGRPQRVFTPRNYFQVKYEIPEGQHGFYLQVGDRFGPMTWDSGGYLNFHYLLEVERKGTD